MFSPNLAWNSFFMHTTLHCSLSTKTWGLTILFKAVLAFPKVALATSTAPCSEIPSCSWIKPWPMRISWPCIHPRILPSSIASQVYKKFCNRSSFGVVHYRFNRLSKSTHLAHLNSLVSIFWLSFTMDIGFFLTSLLTCTSTRDLPFFFIIVLVFYLGH